MSKQMEVDFSEWTKFVKELDAWIDKEENKHQLFISISNELAQRVLRRTKLNTPVAKENGGFLRRNWYVKSAEWYKSNHKSNFKIVTKDKKEIGSGDIELPSGASAGIYDTANYAEYVEYGHRTRGGAGWVEGRFMLTKAINSVNQQADAIARQKLEKELKKVLEK